MRWSTFFLVSAICLAALLTTPTTVLATQPSPPTLRGLFDRGNRRLVPSSEVSSEPEFPELSQGAVAAEAQESVTRNGLPSVKQLASEDPELGVLAALMDEVGATFYVTQSRDITMFMPINRAFNQFRQKLKSGSSVGDEDERVAIIPDENTEAILEGLSVLPWETKWRIVQYHIVPNERVDITGEMPSASSVNPSSSSVASRKYSTWEGTPLSIGMIPGKKSEEGGVLSGLVVDNTYSIDGKSNVIGRPPYFEDTFNGVSYKVDTVLVPHTIDISEYLKSEYIAEYIRDRVTTDTSENDGEIYSEVLSAPYEDSDEYSESQITEMSVPDEASSYYSSTVDDALLTPIDAIYKALHRALPSNYPDSPHDPHSIESDIHTPSSLQPPEFVQDINQLNNKWELQPDERREHLGLATVDNPSIFSEGGDEYAAEESEKKVNVNERIPNDVYASDSRIADAITGTSEEELNGEGVSDEATHQLIHDGEQVAPLDVDSFDPETTLEIFPGDANAEDRRRGRGERRGGLRERREDGGDRDASAGSGAIQALGVGQSFEVGGGDSFVYPQHFGWAPSVQGWGSDLI